MKLFYWLTHYLVRGLFKVLYRHRVFGNEHLPPGPCIIAPNHASFYDPTLVGISCDEEIYFLARKSLFEKFIMRTIIQNLNAVPIAGTTQDLTTFKTISQLLQQGKKVVIFPEGIRTLDGTLSPIKSGIGMLALRSQCVIIPTYIHGTFNIWPRTQRWPRLRGKTACVFGSPIHGKDFIYMEKKASQEDLAKTVQQSIENLRDWYLKGAKGTPP